MKIYNFMTFLYIKSTIFHTFCPITKSLHADTSFLCPLERVCLILQNILNLEKRQYYIEKTCKKCQLFSLKFLDFLKSMHY